MAFLTTLPKTITLMLQSINVLSIDVLALIALKFCYIWWSPKTAFHEKNFILAASVAEAWLGHVEWLWSKHSQPPNGWKTRKLKFWNGQVKDQLQLKCAVNAWKPINVTELKQFCEKEWVKTHHSAAGHYSHSMGIRTLSKVKQLPCHSLNRHNIFNYIYVILFFFFFFGAPNPMPTPKPINFSI